GKAQVWLRELRGEGLESQLKTMRGTRHFIPDVQSEMRVSERPFEHPYYWSGFAVCQGYFGRSSNLGAAAASTEWQAAVPSISVVCCRAVAKTETTCNALCAEMQLFRGAS